MNNISTRRELVEAGAGCGKTYSIVTRYIEALGYDEDGNSLKNIAPLHPKDIVCLTFTELAATQMMEKILLRLEAKGLSHLKNDVITYSQISTFHGYCYKRLQPYLHDLGYTTTTLLPPSLARHRRKSWLLNYFKEHSNPILECLRLHELLNLGLELWHSRGNNDAQQIKDKLFHWKKLLKQKIETTRNELENAISSLDFNISENPDSWPSLALSELKKESPHLETLNFQKQGKPSIKNTFPELYKSIQSLRDFYKSEYHELLTLTTIEHEARTQEALAQYLNQALKEAPKFLDFEALESEFLKLLSSKTADYALTPPKLFIVDEFQDTSPEQFEILKLLSDNSTAWYFVGDPKQSIYSFRKADMLFYNKLRSILSRVELNKNWRSYPHLLEHFNQLQKQLFESNSPLDPSSQTLLPHEDNLIKNNPHGSTIRVYEHDRGMQLTASFLEAFNKRLKEKENRSHAVIFRSWKKLYRFAQELRENNIAYRILGSENFLDHHLTDIFFTFLNGIEDFHNEESRLTLQKWATNNLNLAEATLDFPKISSTTSYDLFAEFVTFIQPRRWVDGAEWTAAIERKLIEFEKLKVDLSFSPKDLAFFLTGELRFDDIELESIKNRSRCDGISLDLMTIHASKGLEFDCVYLMEALESLRSTQDLKLGEDSDVAAKLEIFHSEKHKHLPSLYYKMKALEKVQSEIAESKRVFYVAFTRAKESVDFFIHTPSKSASRDWKHPLEVLDFKTFPKAPWNLVLNETFKNNNYLDVEWIQKENTKVDPEATQLVEEQWLIPLAPIKKLQPVRRSGVSQYLKSLEANPFSFLSSSDTPNSNSDLGTKLHKALSLWDGQIETIQRLPYLDQYPQFHKIFLNLKKLEELNSVWSLAQNNSDFLIRELPMIIEEPNRYLLSGTADLVAFFDHEIWILDWKSSNKLANLQSPGRLKTFQEQLSIYSKGFTKFQKPIRLLAVGIDLNNYNTKVLVNHITMPQD